MSLMSDVLLAGATTTFGGEMVVLSSFNLKTNCLFYLMLFGIFSFGRVLFDLNLFD